jgi:two-component system, chemotaxis family, response regulator WspF
MRIAIVDDRPLAVEVIRRVLAQVPEYTVSWIARDGSEAVQRAMKEPVDLILMDLVMPQLNGVEATRKIMANSPCAILVVTSAVTSNYGLVWEALAAGALDAVNTPVLGQTGQAQGGEQLLQKIGQVAKKLKSSYGSSVTHPRLPQLPALVAIGASTGGPRSIPELLSSFPSDFSGAVLVVQHLDADFSSGLADWLRQKCKLLVRIAQPGDTPMPGVALITGRNDHLILRSDRSLGYTPHPIETPFRPNVDVLFESLASNWPQPGYAALLTGMGKDGAEGLLKLRVAGWTTFAQNQETCSVFGMPDAAIKLGAANYVLPPNEIGLKINAMVGKGSKK